MSKAKSTFLQRRLYLASPLMIALGAAAFGCGGGSGNGSSSNNAGSGDMGAGGSAGTSGDTGGAAGSSAINGDPGRVGLHRLNNTEYNNTVHDLLGTNLAPATNFLAEEGSFDNIASALGMTSPQYEAYFNAAKAVAADVFGNPALSASIMTCAPQAAADDGCAKQIITNLGMRTFRRPLEDTEVTALLQVFDAEVARTPDANAAMQQVVAAMLASPNFLYRIELDPDPATTTVHPLNGYELASRLSYLGWSTMPDQQLFDLAANGSLTNSDVIEQQIDRMLGDNRVSAFVESFAGQWLDIRTLSTHSITPQIFPTYTNELRDAMMQEGYYWFYDFLSQDRDLNQWFTADFNYVNTVLAQHYGMTPPPGADAGMVRVEDTTDQRAGFLGLAAFLTQTSFPSRTSPPKRAAWILSELLCAPSPQPPPNIPKLDDPTDANAPDPSTENVRQRLEAHRADPSCGTCHNLLDPIGLGLENYDGIGQYRDHYGNGDPIDASGVLPNGQTFSGVSELSQILANDPRFTACVTKKLYTYALGREVVDTDSPYLDKIKTDWAARGQNLRNLMKEVVLSDPFRTRHGEAPQP